MNNRQDTYANLGDSYRLAMMVIDDRILTRVDFDELNYDSVISDGEEAIVFNPVTDEISYRIPLEDSNSPLERMFGNQGTMSKINLSLIREEARRLSLNMTEEMDGNRLLLELPPNVIPQNGFDNITSSRVVFDVATETLAETAVVMVREDGTVVTTTGTPIYEDKDGVPVKVGMVTVIDSKAPGLIEDIDPDMTYFNSSDDVPELSKGRLAELQAEGNIHEIPSMVFGDPADLSYVETVYEIYQDIRINSVPVGLFRLIQK